MLGRLNTTRSLLIHDVVALLACSCRAFKLPWISLRNGRKSKNELTITEQDDNGELVICFFCVVVDIVAGVVACCVAASVTDLFLCADS